MTLNDTGLGIFAVALVLGSILLGFCVVGVVGRMPGPGMFPLEANAFFLLLTIAFLGFIAGASFTKRLLEVGMAFTLMLALGMALMSLLKAKPKGQ
jgi:hypothetical protein